MSLVAELYQAKHLTILVPQNPSILEFYVILKDRATDYEVLNLRNVQSDIAVIPTQCGAIICAE